MTTAIQERLTNETTRDTNRAIAHFEDKLAFTTGPVELNRAMQNQEPILVADVRAREDYVQGHIPGALSIPKDELENRLGELSKDKTTIVYCYSTVCHLAAKAAMILARHGYPVIELDGGWDEWTGYGMPLEK